MEIEKERIRVNQRKNIEKEDLLGMFAALTK